MTKFTGTGASGWWGVNTAHCGGCAMLGHVRAHPDLGCADVGCTAIHPDPPRVEGQWTQVCSNGEHHRCFGYVGGPRHDCTCRCHDAHPRDPIIKVIQIALDSVDLVNDDDTLRPLADREIGRLVAALRPEIEKLIEQAARP